MRVLFLRHGESAHNAHSGEEPLSDELGDLLTERGRAQAEAAGAALRGEGVTRLLTSPMRRATETAAAVADPLGLEPELIPNGFEYHAGESFEEAMTRVHALKQRFLAEADGGLPLLVSHGILIRFFLFDLLLGAGFTADLQERIWRLRSCNCGLTTFAHGEPGEPDESLGWTCVTWMARPWDPP
jgi:broad specificity phosphatase PhoE